MGETGVFRGNDAGITERHGDSTGAIGLVRRMSPCIVTTRMVAPCDHCARPAAPIHMPRREHGLYCAECCPVCSPERRNSLPKEPSAESE